MRAPKEPRDHGDDGAGVERQLRFGGALAFLDKDTRLGLAEATALNVPMGTLEQAARDCRFAMIQSHGNGDVTAIARFMESCAGVKIRRKTKE